MPDVALGLPPLASAVLVLRNNSSLGALPHVISAVSQCVDYSVEIPLARACSFGSLRLLRRVWDGSEELAASIGGLSRRRHSCWSPWQFLRSDCHYHRAQFSQGVVEAVRRRDLSMVRWLFDHFSGCVVGVQAVEAAAAAGDLRILQFFLDREVLTGDAQEATEANDSNQVVWGGGDLAAAVENGCTDVARWLYEHKGNVDRDWGLFMTSVVRGGDLELLQWLLGRGYAERQLAPPTMDDAAWGGHLDVLQWLYRHGYVHHASFALEYAARNGVLEIVEWLARYHPVGRGFLDVVKWLNDVLAGDPQTHLYRDLRPYSLTLLADEPSTAIDAAAKSGHLEVLKYLQKVDECMASEGFTGSRPTDTHDAMDGAAAGNHLEIVEWLSAHRSGGCTSAAMDGAATNGYLEMPEMAI
uniref:Uncharacterized protein n=1 Tax=Phytophthora ramorum TaxID=164328 RepID=H3H154_PHYRM